MLERSVTTPWRDGLVVPVPKDPAVRIFGGSIVCSDANGLAVPGRAGAGLAFLGVAEGEAVSGERSVLVRRNCDFLLRSVAGADAVTAERLGRPCYVVDDEFVAASGGDGARPPAGVVTGVRPGGRAWVRGEPAASVAGASGQGGVSPPSLRRIYSGAQTGTGGDRAGAPLDGASATLALPSAPRVMFIRSGWRLYRGSAVAVQGYSEGLYAEGDTHVRTHFGNINWSEFENVGVLSDDVTTVAVGLLSTNIQYSDAFTIEYDPDSQELSFLPVNDPASSLVPVVHSMIVAGA